MRERSKILKHFMPVSSCVLNHMVTHQAQFSIEYTISTDANNDRLVNSDKPSHPDSSNLVNYIVARPDHKGSHAEEVLLDRFNELWLKFRRRPSLILIFSWLMPCGGCTEAIITRLG